MNIIDALIFLIIGFIFYKYYTTTQSESFETSSTVFNKTEVKNEEQNEDYIVDDPKKYIDRLLKANKRTPINPYFSETQYHDDYRDTINAFILIVPNQRIIFNRSENPITSETTPPIREVKRLIGSFIKEVNSIVENKVQSETSLNGWNDAMPQKPIKSGWDKQQEQLGLPTSIYTNPSGKKPIKLIKIAGLEKYTTDDQIRYVANLIVKKKHVNDQMVLRVSFVLDTSDVNLDREFFDEEKSVYETAVQIEEIFVQGFMTKDSFGEQTSLQQLYNYDGINNDGIMRDEHILDQLLKKKKMYEKECYM